MTSKQFPVDAAHAGARVDKFVTQSLPGAGRAYARKLFERGQVRVNGRRASKGDLVREGDQVEIELPNDAEPGSGAIAEPDAPLDVRLETDLVVIVDKPAGQPTAPLEPGERGTLANALVGRYPEMARLGHQPREPGLLHRLDTETSGLLLAARTDAAFAAMAAALKEQHLEKAYLLVCDCNENDELAETGTIEIPLAHHPKDRKRMYPCVHPRDVVRYQPRNASTSFRVIERTGRFALVEARAATATRHQIRAHMAAIGHPLAGDQLYGGSAVPGLTRHALHASRIQWRGNAEVPAFDVVSDPPADMMRLLGRSP